VQKFYVDKETGTSADTNLVFGLAELVDRLIPQDIGDVGLHIEDIGDGYCITLETAIQAQWVAQAYFFDLIPALDTRSEKANLLHGQSIDYIKHQRDNQAYFEAVEKGQDEAELANQGIYPPHPDWPIWAVINQMSATPAYNSLAELWDAHRDCFPQLMELILDLYSTRPNPIREVEATWQKLAREVGIGVKPIISQLQVVNPGMGKGGNRSKATGLGIGGLNGFWLTEYLKFVGFYQVALPRVVKGSKDRKTYILRPKKLSWRTHKQIIREFRKVFYAQTAVKMDALASLSYCQTFIKQWQNAQAVGKRGRASNNPGNHVAAIEVTYYKHLGSAHATMNLSTLALPMWFGGGELSEETAGQFLELIEEHRRVVYRLDEKKGDEYNLLHAYRNFLSGRSLRDFYQFSRGYASHVISELASGKNPPQFSTTNLEVLIMAHDKKLSPILEKEGFRNVAEAIRRSTTIPQRQKARGQDQFYEIRYGLGDKLLRHAQYRDEFIQELSRFMIAYNHETDRKFETRQQRQYRRNLTMEDIEAIVELIDEYDVATVANLLVAFGYARDPNLGRRDGEEEETAEETV
jgi:hypothetical protein